MSGDTLSQTWTRRRRGSDGEPVPGVLLVFTGARPAFSTAALVRRRIALGRGTGRPTSGALDVDDPCMSRRHAELALEPDGRWRVRDLDSRNGTFLDGEPVHGEATAAAPRVLRVGDTLFVPRADLRPFQGAGIEIRDGAVIGPTLRRAWEQVAGAARSGQTLHVTGETGAGKELLARVFHEAGVKAGGPFVPVNCAAIPPLLAERLLFGAKKGAYSDAHADVDGYVQAADGGTLFLDELAELDPSVQAKLLRVIETGEVLPLGAARARKVALRVCSATHRDLRSLVASGRFREDLYFRLGVPHVALPSLRERPEDVAWLVQSEVRALASTLSAHVSLVETALVRPWPGNVRELRRAVAEAAHTALAAGSNEVQARHLSATAGCALPVADEATLDDLRPRAQRTAPSREALEQALRRSQGNISRAARALGTHRTQLRRWLARHNLDPKQFLA